MLAKQFGVDCSTIVRPKRHTKTIVDYAPTHYSQTSLIHQPRASPENTNFNTISYKITFDNMPSSLIHQPRADPLRWRINEVSTKQSSSLPLEVPLPFHAAGLPLYGVDDIMLSKINSPVKQKEANYEKSFKQKQNHFDTKNGNTFSQRYFVNTQWRDNKKNIHFLYIEGENTASTSRVSDKSLPHNILANDKDVGATVWSLEHRFRGKSLPFRKSFSANYKTALSASLAIEDIKNFITTQNNDLRDSPKWVLFGTGYGASLGLWLRQKYPNLTYGIVADSPVIVPTPNFFGYEKFVEQVFSNHSYECWHGVKFAAIAVRNEIQYENGVNRLNDELKLNPKINETKVDYKSLQHLHHNILQLFEVPVVYNNVNVGPFASCCGISDICSIISNKTVRYIERVYNLAKLLYIKTHGSKDKWPGIDNDYEKTVFYLTDHSQSDLDQASARSWLWQQCNEFGQFITTDYGRGLFAATVPNDYFVSLCADVFTQKNSDFTAQNMVAGVKKTLTTFNTSKKYNGPNTTVFYGATDPMQLLGINDVYNTQLSSVTIIPNIGNAAVLRKTHQNDKYPLKMARKMMNKRVKRLLKEKNNIPKEDELKEDDENAEVPKNIKEEKKLAEFAPIKNWLGQLVSMPTEFQDEDLLKKKESKEIKPETVAHHLLRGAVTFGTQLKSFKQNHPKASLPKIDEHKSRKKRAMETFYIEQDVDHFDVDLNLKFNQRYLKNANFQRFKDCARFLMFGGEMMIDWSYVDDDLFQYYRWAKDFKGIVYTLEHRFFGYSHPFKNSSISNMRFLTTEQVLADAAVFVFTMNKMEKNDNPKWIVFGGGYAGNLVAAFRFRYPQLTLGAISSSAPIQAKTDFYEYMQRVEQDIHLYAPTSCASDMRTYYAWNRKKLITRDGRKEIKSAFCLPNHWDEQYIDEKDAQLFIAELVYALAEVIALDEVYGKHLVLNRMCADIKQFNYERYAYKQKRLQRPHGGKLPFWAKRPSRHINTTHNKGVGVKPDDRDDYYEGDSNYYDYDDSQPSRYSDSDSGEPEIICPLECYKRCREPVSYNRLITSLQNIYRDYYFEIYYEHYAYTDEARLWLWLSCTQWGYAHSTNYGYNIYESGLPINFVLDLCTDVFGLDFNRTMIDLGVETTNKKYGGQETFKGSKVLFINHSEDPWAPLSVTNPSYPYFVKNTTSVTVDGTNHVADMFREFDHDLQSLKNARKIAKKQIIRWIQRASKQYPADV